MFTIFRIRKAGFETNFLLEKECSVGNKEFAHHRCVGVCNGAFLEVKTGSVDTQGHFASSALVSSPGHCSSLPPDYEGCECMCFCPSAAAFPSSDSSRSLQNGSRTEPVSIRHTGYWSDLPIQHLLQLYHYQLHLHMHEGGHVGGCGRREWSEYTVWP